MTSLALMQTSLNVPAWGWTFVAFSLCVGVGGALAFFITVIRLSGSRVDKRVLLRCQLLVTLLAIVGVVLQIALLDRPTRALDMFASSATDFSLNFRWWSAISLANWAVAAFAVVAIASEVVIHFSSKSPSPPQSGAKNAFRDILILLGGVLGVAAAVAPGVMLSSTSLPVWGESSWWGAAFLLSSMSVAAAVVGAIALLGNDQTMMSWSNRFDQFISVALLVTFVAIGVSLDHLGWDALESIWGLTFLISTVLGGIILPNIFRLPGARISIDVQGLILLLVTVGSFVLRSAVVFAPETLQ